MSKSETTLDKLNMVGRMLAYHQEQGASTAAALEKIKSDLPGHYGKSIEDLEKMVAGVKLTGKQPGPVKMLAALAAIVRAEKGDVGLLFTGTKEGLQDSLQQAKQYWGGFEAVIFYLVTVLVVAAVIIGVFNIYVLPQFEDLFTSLTAELPAFTRVIIANDAVYMLIIGMLGAAVITCLAVHQHIKNRIRRYMPLSPLCQWVPGVNELAKLYSYFLFIQFTAALTGAGVDAEASFNRARELAQLDPARLGQLSPWWEAINMARKIGVLDTEIHYQRSQIGPLFYRRSLVINESLTTATHTIAGILIGALVIAMYLPIFKLGSII